MIEIHDLFHRTLHIPYLNIAPGHTAIIGPNGSGKTTFLELCAGIEIPTSGEVLIGKKEPRSCDVGWVSEFPDRNMIFERVQDEISSPLRFRNTPCAVVEQRLSDIAADLDLGTRGVLSTRTLSGGEKVLVALSTALISAPELLALDELDTHLDRTTAMKLHDVITSLKLPYILQCTQNMDLAAMADWIVFLEHGKVVYSGSPKDVFPLLRSTCFYPPLWRLQQ